MRQPDWQSEDGAIQLYCGNCLEILPMLEAGSVDAVVTDPPYGIGLRNGDVDGHRSDRWDSIINDQDQWFGNQIIEWSEKNDLPIAIFASPWKPWPGKWWNLIVWDKGGAVGDGGDIATCLKRSWELVQIARNKPINGKRCESVWRFPITPQDVREHIATKPVHLLIMLLEKFTDGGERIIDPCMGLGTTGIACVRTGRKFIGIEIERKYFDIAVKRIEAAIRERSELLILT